MSGRPVDPGNSAGIAVKHVLTSWTAASRCASGRRTRSELLGVAAHDRGLVAGARRALEFRTGFGRAPGVAVDIQLQARPDPRCRRWHAASRSATEASCSGRRDLQATSQSGEAQPGTARLSFSRAGLPIKSIGYLRPAERALLQSATTEALAHLAPAANSSKVLAGEPRAAIVLKLEITLARALLAMRNCPAPETRRVPARAHAAGIGDEGSLPLVMHGQWLGAGSPPTIDPRSSTHGNCIGGESAIRTVGLAVGSSDIGMALLTLGQLLEALLSGSGAADQQVRPAGPSMASDVDGRISTLSFLHNCLLLLGFLDQAAAIAHQAVALRPHNLYSRALAQLRMLQNARVRTRGERRRCRRNRSFTSGGQQGYRIWSLARATPDGARAALATPKRESTVAKTA